MQSIAPIWVLDLQVCEGTLERLGDARTLADKLHAQVAIWIAGNPTSSDCERLIHHGADRVTVCDSSNAASLAETFTASVRRDEASAVLCGGDPRARELASWVAARWECELISPALLMELRGGAIEVIALDATGKLSRRVKLVLGAPAVVTMKDGVAETIAADDRRTGEITFAKLLSTTHAIRTQEVIPADPQSVDIRFAPRIVAGGRGLGGKAGFDELRRFSAAIDASVAASRVAVDSGWIEQARQVGQTGKTVKPELYIACGISGASHHLDGMSESKCIVAINSDRNAPIFKIAHLGLVADLFEVLRHAGLSKEESERHA